VSDDPYAALGIKKDASQDEIQKAYRRLAKKLHPDLYPGYKTAEEQFKTIAAAYDVLSDPEKRARFDRDEIDAWGAERPRQRYYRDFADAGSSESYSSDAGFADFGGTEDLIWEIFGRRGQSTSFRMRGPDAHYRLELNFLDAVNGVKRTLTLADGGVLDVPVPPGTRDGQVLRLRGKGRPGIGGGPPGDALVEVQVHPDPVFIRKGDDIHIELPISLRDAVLGAKLKVPTPAGSVTMAVPRWSNTGRVLRLKGKGVPRAQGGRGDEYVTLKVRLPEKPDPALEKLVARWQPAATDRACQAMEA
jgi:DnaJ-class molecular chaperone